MSELIILYHCLDLSKGRGKVILKKDISKILLITSAGLFLVSPNAINAEENVDLNYLDENQVVEVTEEFEVEEKDDASIKLESNNSLVSDQKDNNLVEQKEASVEDESAKELDVDAKKTDQLENNVPNTRETKETNNVTIQALTLSHDSVLKIGSKGKEVKELKLKLAKLGFVVSSNPNEDFGPKTQQVVKEFQKYYGLPVTGVVDKATSAKLEKNINSPYQLWKSSKSIREIKLKLAKIGFPVSNNPNNDYGLKTAETVKRFQDHYKLKVNGIIDEVTLAKIEEIYNSPIKTGESSLRVYLMKKDLAKLGFVVSNNPNNDFGPKTEQVVKQFQRYYGLSVTGIADKATLDKLKKNVNSPYQMGKSGPEIKEIKLKLAELGFKVSNNPNYDYGWKTTQTVKSFQSRYGLKANGIVDEVTLAKIDELLNSPLQVGMSSLRVYQMKLDLAKLGFVVSNNPNWDYGPKTKKVVEEFQAYYGLKKTGVADNATLDKLKKNVNSPYQMGKSSPQIKEFKLKLAALGFPVSNNPNNDYGPKTAQTVKRFQEAYGLRVNGIGDEITLKKVDELYESKISLGYTHYDITFDEALEIQMKSDSPPQTDKYRNAPAYVSNRLVKVYDRGTIAGSRVNLRTSPELGTNENIYASVNRGTVFAMLDKNVKGSLYSGSTQWYKILYNGQVLYVHSSLANISGKVAVVDTAELNVRSTPDTRGHVFGKVKRNTLLRVVGQNDKTGWYQVEFSTWRNAKKSDVAYYLNPNNFVNDKVQKFQFLNLTESSGVTVDVLNNFLKGKGILEGKGAAFIEAGKKHGINEIYLVSHAILETGNGTSELATGVVYNGVKVYNMFGIGATDDNPINNGAKRAYEEGWTTPEKAIIGGAAFIGNDYIKKGQNTLYKMRWNPEGMVENKKATDQYATDIGWAAKQVVNLYNLYEEIGSYRLVLDIPVYKK